jgi:hypothetical protein
MRTHRSFALRDRLTLLPLWTGAAIALAASACTPPDPGGGKDKPKPTHAVIGATGGSVASADGALTVEVPAGALGGDVDVTVTPTDTPSGGAGPAFDIGPSGTVFAAPVTLTFDVGDANETTVRAAQFADGAWLVLDAQALDATAHTVSGQTLHLSTYGTTSADDAQVCAAVGGGCPVGADPGPGGGGGGAQPCTLDVSCTSGDPCTKYPGAALGECAQSDTGFSGSCCFPADALTCVTTGAGGAPVDPGPGGGSPPPPPTCATATNICDAAYGFTVDSCVDDANGYAAVCCAPAGTPFPAPTAGAPVDPGGGGP